MYKGVYFIFATLPYFNGGIPVPRVTNCMNAHTRGDTCVASRGALVVTRVCALSRVCGVCICGVSVIASALAHQDDLARGGLQVPRSSRTVHLPLAALVSKSFPRSTITKMAGCFSERTILWTDRRRHSTPTRYQLTRLKRGTRNGDLICG